MHPPKTTKKPAPPQSRQSRNSPNVNIITSRCRRRDASWRLPALESGRFDPWHYEPPTAGYEDAAAHLLELGLTPAPDIPALQAMWKSGRDSRAVAQLIVERWGLVV